MKGAIRWTRLNVVDHSQPQAEAPVLDGLEPAGEQTSLLDATEFFAFGWEDTFAISANHGRGVADLLPPAKKKRGRKASSDAPVGGGAGA